MLECVQVYEINLDGWWRVGYGGREGWAPASCLAELKGREADLSVMKPDQLTSTVDEAQRAAARPGSIVKLPPPRPVFPITPSQCAVTS